MVLSGVPRKKSPVTVPGNDPGTVRPVVQYLHHNTTPDPIVSEVEYTVSEKDFTLFLFFFLGAQCVESGVSCTDCY